MLNFLEIDEIDWKLISIGGIVTFIISYILSLCYNNFLLMVYYYYLY